MTTLGWNQADGILVSGVSASSNVVLGNYVGVDANGAPAAGVNLRLALNGGIRSQWGVTAASFFDGVESCHICFCVLTEGGALPKIKCANCLCGFHSECLAKWFATSHVSKCCMCQLPFKRK